MDNYEDIDRSELRRQARASLERNAISNDPDKIQLKDIMLYILIALATIVSMTDFSLSWQSFREFTALTVFLFVITTLIYQNRYEKGKSRGKREEGYAKSLSDYRTARDSIYNNNLAKLVPIFCQWYRKKELREYRENLLTDIDMEYEEYREKYLRLSDKEILKSNLSSRTKKILIKANKAQAIKLSAGMILNESGEANRNKLLGQSGKEREKKDKRMNAISRIAITLFAGTIAIDLIMDFSLLTIAQWCVRMIPIASAIIFGDDSGYCDIVVTESTFKQNQISVIKLFNEFAEENKDKPSEVPTIQDEIEAVSEDTKKTLVEKGGEP